MIHGGFQTARGIQTSINSSVGAIGQGIQTSINSSVGAIGQGIQTSINSSVGAIGQGICAHGPQSFRDRASRV
jgi:hypothetical protein